MPPRNASPRRQTGGQQVDGHPGTRVTRRTPSAYVSLHLPFGRRRWCWYSYSCRTCGAHQLGRTPRLEDVAGVRKAGCGHKVNIVIARIYGQGAA
jgi:hypothetical protein